MNRSAFTIQVSQEIVDRIMADVRGKGGFQSLLRKLQGQMNVQALMLTLDPGDLKTIPQYESYRPGDGRTGFFRLWICCEPKG
jgi:hypothetical protein